MLNIRDSLISACASLALVVSCVSGIKGQAPNPPPAQPKPETELNTVMMESTFKIEGRGTQNQPVIGTVFLMGRPFPNDPTKGRYVLITAAHVLDDMQGDTAVIHLRKKADGETWSPSPQPLQIRAHGQPLWLKYPDADVAVMYIEIPPAVRIPLLSTDLLADDATLAKFEIHPGDTLQCLGYPLGIQANEAGFPILRSGKIASYPLLPTESTKTFLLDFNVFQGNSGSPAYMVESNRMYQHGVYLGQTIGFIAGLVSQEVTFDQQSSGLYFVEAHQYPLGLAVVVHASLIKKAVYMLPSPETLPN